MRENDIDIFTLIETDLHSKSSRIQRATTLTTELIQQIFKVKNTNLILPPTWNTHGQARILTLISSSLKYKILRGPKNLEDIPMITIEVGGDKHKKVVYVFIYREHKSNVSGLDSHEAQLERLRRICNHLHNLHQQYDEVITAGDLNLDFLRFGDPEYNLAQLSDYFQDHLMDNFDEQLVREPTRLQMVGGELQSSVIDHLITNRSSHIKKIKV